VFSASLASSWPETLSLDLDRFKGARSIGDDPTPTAVLSTIQRVAGTETTVLLEGESGTGKELFARALHALS